MSEEVGSFLFLGVLTLVVIFMKPIGYKLLPGEKFDAWAEIHVQRVRRYIRRVAARHFSPEVRHAVRSVCEFLMGYPPYGQRQ